MLVCCCARRYAADPNAVDLKPIVISGYDDVLRQACESDTLRIIPSYSYCPQQYEPCAGDLAGDLTGDLAGDAKICLAVQEKVRTICRDRQAD